MRSLGTCFVEAVDRLKKKGILEPKRDVTDLFTQKLQMDRLSLMTEGDKLVDETLVEEGIERLEKGEPIAYILGSVSFFGCKIAVGPSVLIPRPETELLVALIVEQLRGKSGTLVDLCTGSGCIGIALKKALPSFEIILTDISSAALSLAKRNAESNGVEVTLLEGDFLEPLKGKTLDVFVSNPPYISPEEYLFIDRSVRDFEPKLALVAQNNGLYFYEKIAKELPPLMKAKGKLFLEIGYTQGEKVSSLFIPPLWKETKVRQDLASHPRFMESEYGG